MPLTRRSFVLRTFTAIGAVALVLFAPVTPELTRAEDPPKAAPPTGLRVFSAGHSFHVFMPGILQGLAKSAEIKEHNQVGVQSIGGSRVIQHWDLADDKNKAKDALKRGKVDVLTLSPIYLPDDGIENFVRLAVEHNPNVRVLIQEFWLPFDVYKPDYQKQRPEPVDRNARTIEQIREQHNAYFKTMDEHVAALNEKLGKPAVSVVPVGQAVVLLREKIIAGEAPGLKMQNDLFTDPIGHATAPLQVLVAYCHYAAIYRVSPVGLPAPPTLERTKNEEWTGPLNRLLQELAWKAVTEHPLSGVKAADAKPEAKSTP